MHALTPDEGISIPDLPLAAYVFEYADKHANRPALIDGATGRVMTYRDLVEAIERGAAGIAARGFEQGDVFAVAMPNQPEFAVAFHAVTRAGGAVLPLNPLLTADEMAYQLRDAGARYLLAAPPALEAAFTAASQSGVEEVFVVGEWPTGTPFGALLDSDSTPPNVAIHPADHIAALPYSSGTTGLPKGVMLTHRNLVANLAQLEAVEPVGPDDILIGLLPFFHIYGLTFVLNLALRVGAAVVAMPRFEIGAFLGLIENYHVTRAPLVPPVVMALAQHPLVDEYDLSSLRTIVSGAAPLGAEIAADCAERLGCIVKQGYGLTEASPVTHINPEDAVRRGTVGLPLPGTSCRIVDPESEVDSPPGQPGEVWIRGPQVMTGYLGRSDATADAIREGGWLRTGDIGTMDDDGYLRIVDRLKEMIKVKGFQVAPAELEAVLVSHPAVQDAAVVPVADPELGEAPRAFVVRKGEVEPDELIAFVAGQVAPYKKVRHVTFVDAIPRSASGKILRRELRERSSA
jgi:acyl-CoA synthetase (AMP-forming)/AMP-acid ligase II